ncbi:tryptophan synthase subunit alpha [Aestuariimicrobium ganziense]|uniref:tryptophan synthase subunit alpha n=1 Tax=Aestuariimicrobium ganziense TaxID=2773677 RepID=UPI0019411698|nr:tryptophan synthase subunit alpha [Aestuariimicrobium ganziense]
MSSGDIFRNAKDEGRAALVGYLPVGYPSVEGSIEAMRTIVAPGDGPGVDLVEIGAPYSDPVMDGVSIQHAATRALERGVRTSDVFRAVEAVNEAGCGVVVMTYWNLVERYGVDRYAADLAQAGGAGLITPDLTPDEAETWMAASEAHGLDRIFLVSPSSTDRRLSMTLDACRGWVYATSLMGVTGTRTQVASSAPELVARIRQVSDIPVGVGLGVSNGDQAAAVAGYADAVIVGSVLVNEVIEAERTGGDAGPGLRRVVADLAAGVRRPGVGAP